MSAIPPLVQFFRPPPPPPAPPSFVSAPLAGWEPSVSLPVGRPAATRYAGVLPPGPPRSSVWPVPAPVVTPGRSQDVLAGLRRRKRRRWWERRQPLGGGRESAALARVRAMLAG
jgi:hypothetical protein